MVRVNPMTQFPLKPTPWPTKGLRRASINSFGFGGTNAHAILDDAFHYLQDHKLFGNHNTVQDPPLAEDICTDASSISPLQCESDFNQEADSLKLLVLSSFDEDGLTRLAERYRQHFAEISTLPPSFNSYLESLAYTLNSRRSLLPWKSYLLVKSMADLFHFDSRLSPGQRSLSNPLVGFIFTGQGAQWVGMGRDLRVFDIFEQRLREAEEHLIELGCLWQLRGMSRLSQSSIRQILTELEELLTSQDQTNINRPEFSQPILTAIQVALVDLLRSFGVHPTAVLGHSSGEIAAA